MRNPFPTAPQAFVDGIQVKHNKQQLFSFTQLFVDSQLFYPFEIPNTRVELALELHLMHLIASRLFYSHVSFDQSRLPRRNTC